MSILLAKSNRRQPRLGHYLVLNVFLLFASSADADQTPLDKVEALHKERIAVLEELVKLRQREYSEGISAYDPIARAMDQLADAKFDAAKTPAERLAVRTTAVDRWSEFEKLVTAKFEAALVSQGDLLAAKAGHLRAKLLAAQELVRKE